MGFILGLLMGLLVAIGLFGFLAYWLCSRPNNIALARFINGIAQALACLNKAKPVEPPSPDQTGNAVQDTFAGLKGKAREKWTPNDENGDKK